MAQNQNPGVACCGACGQPLPDQPQGPPPTKQEVHINVGVLCPDCPTVVRVPIRVKIVPSRNGGWELELEPDTSDLWAHSWTHEPPGDTG